MDDKNIIAILGGMGPYAGLEFSKKILTLTPARKDWEHIHTIIDNNSKIPSRTRHILYNEENPSKYIIESINKLAAFGAIKVFLPCNSVHYFYDQVSPYINIPWVNLIKVVADKISQSNKTKTIVLGAYTTITQKLYDKYLPNLIYLSDIDNKIVYEIIEATKLNDLQLANDLNNKLLFHLENYNFDSVILACTELTLITNLLNNENFTTFDSNLLYARYLIDSSNSDIKN